MSKLAGGQYILVPGAFPQSDANTEMLALCSNEDVSDQYECANMCVCKCTCVSRSVRMYAFTCVCACECVCVVGL